MEGCLSEEVRAEAYKESKVLRDLVFNLVLSSWVHSSLVQTEWDHKEDILGRTRGNLQIRTDFID